MAQTLYQHSIDIIRNNQHASGAYIASPNFEPYLYSWFRDGAYIAYAMDLAGERQSAARFYDWAARVILQQKPVVGDALAHLNAGKDNAPDHHLHTRYSATGAASDEDWPNFQLDGFGTLLWAAGEHLKMQPRQAPDTWQEAFSITADYLAALWQTPCYDCWEEFPTHKHLYTLAAIYGGLKMHQAQFGGQHQRTLDEIHAFITRQGVTDGHFVKYLGTSMVDASLLGLALPYRVVEMDDRRMLETVARIESDLRAGGGVHRYPEDSYYGGGEWVLLTAWLGWYYAEMGELQRAREMKAWVECQANTHGELPEQVPHNLNKAAMLDVWRQRWGEIATPLLWSHAKYIILCKRLEKLG